MNKKVVIYLRVSSREQKEGGFSIPSQRKLLTDYARKNDFKIIKEFEDNETAKMSGRKAFGEMVSFLKDRKNKDINTILVEKTDRLYRNFKDYVIIDELGITVFLVKENEIIGKDASSHQKFIHGIKVLMAKNYIDNLSEEVRKGLKEKAESGIYPCSHPPLGYILKKRENEKSILIVDEKNRLLIEKMFEYYSTGLYSIQSLVEKLKKDGLLVPSNFPKNSKLTTLTKSTIHRILSNPVYYGDFLWNDKLYQGTHEAIISKELWDKAQEILNRYKDKKILSKYNTRKFIFKGLLQCGECGRTISADRKIKPSGKKYVYYSCTKYKTNCLQKAVNEKKLDEQIIDYLNVFKIPHKVISYITEDLKQSLSFKRRTEDKFRDKLENEKKRIEKRIDALYEDKLDNVISKDFYNRKFREYEAKIRDLEAKISRYSDANIDYYKMGVNILELAKKACFLYKKGNIEEKQELLHFLLANSLLKDGNLLPEYKKPFDTIYQRALCCDWRSGRESNPRSSA